MKHVANEDLAGYLEHRLDRESERRVEAHMAECATCRADLVQIRALMSKLPTSRTNAHQWRVWPRRAWLAAAGLAAVLLVPLTWRAEQRRTVSSAAALRATATPSRITVVAPDPAAPERSIDPEKVVFVWRAVEGAGAYHITLTDSAGTPVFATSTSDTTITPSLNQALAHGSSYLWYVDALRNDGSTWSTGVQSFTTTR